MNTGAIRVGINARLTEARELLTSIRAAEAPLQPLPALPSVLRGFIFVSCYGCVEFAITQGTHLFINEMRSMGVQNGHLELVLNSVSLHPELSSLESSAGRPQWKGRRELFERLGDASVCKAPDTVFGAFLHNVDWRTIEEIFAAFGIAKPPTAQPRERGYIESLRERRNAVAHGRETATDAGQGKTSADLEKFLNVAYDVSLYFLDCLEDHVTQRAFVRAAFRPNYP